MQLSVLSRRSGQKLLVSSNRFTLLVICEAGSANLLLSYFDKIDKQVRVWAEGVACEIATGFGFEVIKSEDLKIFSPEIDEIFLAGTVGDQFNQISIVEEIQREFAVKIFYVFDNWVNYAERFKNCKIENAVVFDDYARDFVLKTFGRNIDLEIKPNEYLRNIREEVEQTVGVSQETILFLGNRINDFTTYTPGVHGLECFCTAVDLVSVKFPKAPIVFRPHPGSGLGSCASLLASTCDYFQISSASLAFELSRSRLVIGNPTYALYIASELGIPVASLNPSNEFWGGPIFPDYRELLN